MSTELKKAKELLTTGGYSLVVLKNSLETLSFDRGIRPLLDLYTNEPELLRDSTVADKVIGKAAALILAVAGIRELYARLISRPALEVLEKQGITVVYQTLTDNILNRDQSGLCPMEQLCADTDDPHTAIERITAFITAPKG